MNPRLAGCTFIYPRRPLEEGLRTVASFGFHHADVGIGGLHGHVSPIEAAAQPEEHAERVRIAAEKFNVSLSECFTLNFGSPINEPDVITRNETRERFAGLARFAANAGFASILLLPGPVHKRLGRRRSFDLSVESLKPLAEIAIDNGVSLHVETDCDSCANSPDAAEELCDRVRGIRLTLDYSHFIFLGHEQKEIERLHRYTGHVHVRQAAPKRIVGRVDSGSIDFTRVIKGLACEGYDGLFSVEYLSCKQAADAGIECISETHKMAAVFGALLEETKGIEQWQPLAKK